MKNINIFLISLMLFSNAIQGQTNMHITEQLLNSTIRIEAINDSFISTGTGFHFDFKNQKKETIPVIITNKHVVLGSKVIRLFFKKTINNEPDYGPPFIVTIENNAKTVIQHPNKDIDLVAIPISFILNELSKSSIDIFYISLTEDRIPSDSTQKTELKSIENIWMIGYPNGLWDMKNNLPIVREGITATTPYIDYNGKREFLVDVAAFPGSSGSPIFFYRDFYTDKADYKAKVGIQLYLLGILYSGPQFSAQGNVIKVNPTDPNQNVSTNIPMNLGCVIKASEILEFKKLLFPK
jgi:hypothetical protein